MWPGGVGFAERTRGRGVRGEIVTDDRDHSEKRASAPRKAIALSPRAFEVDVPRRRVLRPMAFGSALVAVPGQLAEQTALTPRQTEGPFDPDVLPPDTDNDVVGQRASHAGGG